MTYREYSYSGGRYKTTRLAPINSNHNEYRQCENCHAFTELKRGDSETLSAHQNHTKSFCQTKKKIVFSQINIDCPAYVDKTIAKKLVNTK